jgi:hypothetical protein
MPPTTELVLETVRKLPHVPERRHLGISETEAERLAGILQLHHLMESQGSASGMQVSRGCTAFLRLSTFWPQPIYHWILTLGNTDFPHHAQFKWTNMALQANFFLNDRVPAAQAEVQRMAVVWASGLGAHQDGQDLGQLLQTTDWAATSWLIRSVRSCSLDLTPNADSFAALLSGTLPTGSQACCCWWARGVGHRPSAESGSTSDAS